MPFDMFIAAALINRWIAVPILAIMAAAYHFNTWSLGDHIGYIAYCAVYAFLGWATRHVLQEEITENLHERRENRRLAEERDRQAELNWKPLTPTPEPNQNEVESHHAT